MHKLNVLELSEGLCLRETPKLGREHPEPTYEEQLVASMAALLVRDVRRFDGIVTTNMSKAVAGACVRNRRAVALSRPIPTLCGRGRG